MPRGEEAVTIHFEKKGCQPITIPKHEPIKKKYVEMVKQVVENEEAENDSVE